MEPIAERGWQLRVGVASWVAGAVFAFAAFLWRLDFSPIEIATSLAAFCAIALMVFAGASVWHRRKARWAALAAAAAVAVAVASVYLATAYGAWLGIAAGAIVGVIGLLRGAPYEDELGADDPVEVGEAELEERDAERRSVARNSADSIRPF